jgi:uncharacterized membrane protein
MLDSMIALSLTIAAIGAGLMAGVYFAFSGFIMRSLDQLGAVPATDAMNAINEVILRSWFMALFFGSTLLYAVLAAVAVFDTDLAGRWLLFTGGLIYVVGMFLCTALFNVPLNNRLANAGNDDNAKAETWTHYFKHWTRWNHLRSVCSLLTKVLNIHYLVSYT